MDASDALHYRTEFLDICSLAVVDATVADEKYDLSVLGNTYGGPVRMGGVYAGFIPAFEVALAKR